MSEEQVAALSRSGITESELLDAPRSLPSLHERAHEDLSQEIPLRSALMVAVAAGLGYAFDAYAVNIYGLVLPLITVSLALSPVTAGVIGSIFLVGYTVGTMGFGIAADKFGRKDALGVSILLYGITTTLGGIGTSTTFFTIMRFLTGVGGAGELAVGAPYTCEMFKTRHRGVGTGGIMFSLYSLGYILAGLAALFVVPAWGWRAVFLIAMVPATAVFLFQRLSKESTRWAIKKTEAKFEAAHAELDAEHAMHSLNHMHAGETRLGERAARPADVRSSRAPALTAVPLGLLSAAALGIGLLVQMGKAPAAALVTGGALGILAALSIFSFQRTAAERFWHAPVVRKRIGIGWLLYTANAMGYWGLSVFLTTFMVKKFGVTPRTAILYAIMFYGVQFVLSYVGTGLSDRIGRRLAGILGALIMIGCTIVAATTSQLGVFLVFGALQIGMLGWLWGVGDTYLSELFPTAIRGSSFAIGVGGGRVMSIAAPFLVGAGIAAFGPTVPFLATAGLWVLTIIGYLLGPETARKPLEQIEAEFHAEEAAWAAR